MLRILRTIVICAVATVPAGFAHAAEVHVRLVDRLDRAADGYCLDIVGTASNMQLDLPLFAHNCKAGASADSAIIYTSDGQLVFPGAGVCITAFGVNGRALPGVPLLLRPCDDRAAFFDASAFQQYEFLENGQLKLRDHELCMGVGDDSLPTFSSQDSWRVLMLESCSSVNLQRSMWEFVPL